MAFLWLIILVAMIIVELFTMGITTIWFAGGALFAMLAKLLGAPLWLQILVFLVVSVLSLAAVRPLAVKYWNKSRTKTNVDSMLEAEGLVQEEIDNLRATGRISVRGQDWAAKSEGDTVIPVGTTVVVVSVQGVKLVVKEKNA